MAAVCEIKKAITILTVIHKNRTLHNRW